MIVRMWDHKLMHTCIIHVWLYMLLCTHFSKSMKHSLSVRWLVNPNCVCSHFSLYFWVYVNVLCPVKVSIVFLVWWLFTSSHICWLLILCWVTSNVSLYKSSFYYNRDKYESITNTKKYKGNTPTTKCCPKTKVSTISKGFQAEMSCVQRL